MGGLAIYRPTYHSPYRQVGISLAGPGAGFVLAAITAVLVIATGHKTEIVGGYYVGWGSEFSNDQLRNLVYFLMQVKLIWGCVNLLPIFPLDGGKIAQELWSAQDPITGMRKTLVLSIVVSVIGAAIAWFSVEDKLLALFFTVFSITNYLNLRQISSGGFGGGYGDNYEGGSGGGFDDGYEDSRGGRGW
jgi:stage IV sporulation protein FB